MNQTTQNFYLTGSVQMIYFGIEAYIAISPDSTMNNVINHLSITCVPYNIASPLSNFHV